MKRGKIDFEIWKNYCLDPGLNLGRSVESLES